MYDRETDSLWSQLIGEAIQGYYQGTKLEFLPSFQTTWEDWKSRHPNTLALQKGYYGNQDPYTGYYDSSQTGVIEETFSDDRLYEKEFVIGVELDEQAIAFPFSVLNNEPLVNYENNNNSFLVLFDQATGLGIVFDRTVEDQLLSFKLQDNFKIIDNETGSTWDGITGEAIDGPLAGKRLTRLKSTASFWFGWKDFHPDTIIYGLEHQP